MEKINRKNKCVLKNCDFLASENEIINRNLYRFPQDIDRKELWIKALYLDKTKINSNSKVCSRHFKTSDYGNSNLGGRAIPSENIRYNFVKRKLIDTKEFKNYDFLEEMDEINGKY
jgi:hypothetical protein